MKRPRRFSCFVSPGPLGSHRSLQRLPNPACQAFARHPTRIVGRSEGEGPRWRVCTNGHRSEDPHTTKLGSSPFCLLIYCLVTHQCRSSPLNQSFGPFIEPKSNGKFNLYLPYLPSVFTISIYHQSPRPTPPHDPSRKNLSLSGSLLEDPQLWSVPQTS